MERSANGVSEAINLCRVLGPEDVSDGLAMRASDGAIAMAFVEIVWYPIKRLLRGQPSAKKKSRDQ